MTADRARAVLFDLDGVIVDSRRFHLEAWEHLARAHDLPVTPGYFTETFGLRNDAILGRLVPHASTKNSNSSLPKETRFRALVRGSVRAVARREGAHRVSRLTGTRSGRCHVNASREPPADPR